jgi:hypothetical protein
MPEVIDYESASTPDEKEGFPQLGTQKRHIKAKIKALRLRDCGYIGADLGWTLKRGFTRA